MMLTNTDVLLIIDVQNDFLPGGALAVPDGDAVVAPINRLAACVPHVILTQDWHPPGHASFHGSHPGKAPSTPRTCPTVNRCSGRSTACRAPTVPSWPLA